MRARVHEPAARRAGRLALTLAVMLGATWLYSKNAVAQSLPSTGTIAVPTYEAVGLYWSNPGGTAGCEVKYRVSGASAWSQGLAMWYDARDTQCRGSLVNLAPNTQYEVQLNLPGQAASRQLSFRTWANTVPVAKTVTVASGSATLNITEGGTASGYVVYQAASGAVLDARNAAQFNVTVNASYVVLRGLTLKGAQQDAIRIAPNVTNVVIEDNDISGWGRQRQGQWGVDMDSAIRAVCSTPTLERVTIQRNRIHDPRYSANSWSDGHPAGPQAVTFSYCGGNHVIRHNEVYSTNGNYFNDILGGEDNFTKGGFPYADADIYGNRLSHGWDDGIEAEGANENIRIWGNYIDRTAIGIATTVTSVGPAYIFRNVWNRAQMYEKIASLDQDDRQPFFKSGSDASLGFGRRYFFHNTMLQAQQAGLQYGLGGGFGMGGTGASQLIENTWSKNNIYHLWKPKGAFYQTGSSSVIANDMYNGTPGDVAIASGINATPQYAPGNGWVSEAGGMYQLARGTPGYDQAERIPNFNDRYAGAGPDVGAHEADTEAMKFGIAASPGSAVSGVAPAPPPVTSTYTLAVTKSGTGSGTVSSSSGIDCGTTCSASLASGTAVTLNAAAAAGSTFAGWYGGCSGTGACTVSMTAASTVGATFNASAGGGTGGVSLSASALTFSTAATTRTVTYTNNTGSKVTFIQASMTSARFGQTNNCADVAAGASCTATVTYYATNTGSDTGTLTLTSTAPNSPHVVTLTAGATATGPSLVAHFYRSILRREPDAAGQAYWDGEVARVTGLGVSASEVWYAMAASFFASGEYASFGRDDTGFVTDLYTAFFNRAPDATGLGYWVDQIRQGVPRNVILTSFMFSSEFAAITGGGKSARLEIDLVLDFYRGLLARLPDTGGFLNWVQIMRTAQCQGGNAVNAQADAISSAFISSAEFAARGRDNALFVSDLYNAFLRRGGDAAGVRYWVQQLGAGMSRDDVRRAFMSSPEFSARVALVVQAGCGS